MNPVAVVFNEASGPSTGERGAMLGEAFAAVGLDARIVPASGAEIVHAARRAVAGARVLVAAGGDGTVSAVASVAAKSGATFGVVPFGTLNHFARDAGIALDLQAAAAAIAAGRTRLFDVGDLNGLLFLNNASLGVYPDLVRERQAQQGRGRRKWAAAAIGIVRTWRAYRMMTVRMTLDGGPPIERRTPFVFLGNGDYREGGPKLGTRRSIGAHLSVSIAPELGRFEALALAVRALADRLPSYGKFESFSSNTVSIEVKRSELTAALDGELTVVRAPLRFAIRRGVLRTLVPAAA